MVNIINKNFIFHAVGVLTAGGFIFLFLITLVRLRQGYGRHASKKPGR